MGVDIPGRRADEDVPTRFPSLLEQTKNEPVKVKLTAVDRGYYVPLVKGLYTELSSGRLRHALVSQLTGAVSEFYDSFQAIKAAEGPTPWSDTIEAFLVANGWDGRQFSQQPDVDVLVAELTAINENTRM